MRVLLLSHTGSPEQLIAAAMRLCYSGKDVEDLIQTITPEKADEMVGKALELGHLSVLEHASYSFAVEGISRACSHQLVRHRLASYSQQSQRYVDLSKKDLADYSVMPTSVSGIITENLFNQVLGCAEAAYKGLLAEGVPGEDARFVLPNACETKIIITMNARTLLHFFEHRCCQRAQWEIRAMAKEMLRLAREVSPVIFAKAGPTCVTEGYCREAGKSCGAAPTLQQLLELWQDLHNKR